MSGTEPFDKNIGSRGHEIHHESHEGSFESTKMDHQQPEKSPISKEPKSPREMSTLVWVSVVISLLFSMFLFSLDNVIVADIQPSIVKTLGNVDKLPWVSVAYALGGSAVNLFVSVVFIPFGQGFADISL